MLFELRPLAAPSLRHSPTDPFLIHNPSENHLFASSIHMNNRSVLPAELQHVDGLVLLCETWAVRLPSDTEVKLFECHSYGSSSLVYWDPEFIEMLEKSRLENRPWAPELWGVSWPSECFLFRFIFNACISISNMFIKPYLLPPRVWYW